MTSHPRTLIIRPARPEDATAMLQVHRDAILAKASRHYELPALNAWAVGVTTERVARFEQQIADPAFIFVVAEVAREVIGFGVAVPAERQLRSLYVKPNAFGRVGHAILHEVERSAFRTAEELSCDASLNAAAFYRSHGYTEEGPLDHVLSSGHRIPCLRMKKSRPLT